jgi:hypothetical protein
MKGACLVCLAVALAAGAAAVWAAPASRVCGRITVGSVAYRVRVVTGKVTCVTARRVMTTFLRRNVSPRGWFCVRGHRSQNQAWAASCGTPVAEVRAFGPIRS